MFKDAKTILLNHLPDQADIDPAFTLRHVSVQPNARASVADQVGRSEFESADLLDEALRQL